MWLEDLNAADRAAAERALLQCWGSTRWARAMAAARPFASADALHAKADETMAALAREDWLEAFAAHPRIGDREAGGAGRGWSQQEQAGVEDASRARLAAANREYEARFGYIHIVCATGKTGDEMLAILERRLCNDAQTEIRVAAGEQRKITHLRLDKLLQ